MNFNDCGRKRSWPSLKQDLGIRLQGLREEKKFLSQVKKIRDRELSPVSSIYELRDLTVLLASLQQILMYHKHICSKCVEL
jgi:hypothetical protein